MIKQTKIPDSAKHMPFVAMLREGSLRDDWGLRQDAADRIADLEKTLRAIVEMIDDCPDAPTATDSLPQAVRFYADGALRGIDTGVK